MAEFAALAPLIGGVASAGATIAASSNRPKIPKPEPAKRMPDPESAEVVDARRRRLAERSASGGRDSTILSDETYSNSLLGE